MAIDERGLKTANSDDSPHVPFPAWDTVGPLPAFLRIRDVLRITALSRPTLYRRIAARRFPPPVHLGGRACGWRSTAVQTWISDPDGYRAPDAQGARAPCRRGRPRKYPD